MFPKGPNRWPDQARDVEHQWALSIYQKASLSTGYGPKYLTLLTGLKADGKKITVEERV